MQQSYSQMQLIVQQGLNGALCFLLPKLSWRPRWMVCCQSLILSSIKSQALLYSKATLLLYPAPPLSPPAHPLPSSLPPPLPFLPPPLLFLPLFFTLFSSSTIFPLSLSLFLLTFSLPFLLCSSRHSCPTSSFLPPELPPYLPFPSCILYRMYPYSVHILLSATYRVSGIFIPL